MSLFSYTMNTSKEKQHPYLKTLMDSPKSNNGTATLLHNSSTRGKAKAAVVVPIAAATTKPARWKKLVAIFDFILRLVAIAAGLAAASIMGTTEETLPFFTQFLQFHAEYNDFPTFTFFVIANAGASAYLILSLPLSIVCIVRPHVSTPRFILLILDTVMGVATTAAASSAASIVYLAHNGNVNANWTAICQQFGNFCQQVSLAVVASFVAALNLAFLVVLSMFALKRTTTKY